MTRDAKKIKRSAPIRAGLTHTPTKSRSREKMRWSGFDREGYRLFAPQEVLEFMQTTGFCGLRLDHRYQDRACNDVVVVGTC